MASSSGKKARRAQTQPLNPIEYGFKDVKTFPGLRCKNKWFYEGKYRFEKAYYLFPFLQFNNGSWFDLIRKFLPAFLKGHARSIIAIGKK